MTDNRDPSDDRNLEREQELTKKMAELEPRRRKNLSANWDWTRYKLELNRLRLARGEAPIDPDHNEEAAYEAMKERLAQREAMADPEKWAPITKQGFHTVTFDELDDTLTDAKIFAHTDFPDFEFIEGWLASERGGFAFIAVKPLRPDGLCLMAVPDMVE